MCLFKATNDVKGLCALALLSLPFLAAVSQAGVAITGNPALDSGWAAQGNSLDNGVYIRGSGGLAYQVYTTSFVIEPGSPLIASGWSVGDTVLAMGGVIQATNGVAAGWGSGFAGSGTVNGNLTTSVRIVAKFGTSSSDFTPSTVKPYITTGTTSNGNGHGSLDSGYGGEGAILLGTAVGELPVANDGAIIPLSENLRYTNSGATATAISSSVGRLVYHLNGNTSSSLLNSWEVMLNASLLSSLLASGSPIPVPGDQVNMALQRSSNAYQFNDALAATPALQADVPEPSTLMIGSVWCAVSTIGYVLRRRRQSD